LITRFSAPPTGAKLSTLKCRPVFWLIVQVRFRHLLGRDHVTVADDALLTSSPLDNGCYGSHLAKPNSLVAHDVGEGVQAIDYRVSRLPRWPGISTVISAYQRHIHGN